MATIAEQVAAIINGWDCDYLARVWVGAGVTRVYVKDGRKDAGYIQVAADGSLDADNARIRNRSACIRQIEAKLVPPMVDLDAAYVALQSEGTGQW